ncbi:hypothetical protein N7445_003504 [Penicillium cf. griseofulvum]|nr:hypothetical protein N7445_003504 [Penicillium cf. griseofulvum]
MSGILASGSAELLTAQARHWDIRKNLDFTSTLRMAIVIGLQYVGPHITLSILASIEPLTLEYHKSKMHRLLRRQRTLASKSQLAAQGLALSD